MKKFLKVVLIIIAVFAVIIFGMAACTSSAIKSVGDSINEMEEETKKETKELQDMAKDMKWDVKKDDLGWTTFSATFENTSNKDYDYAQFDFELKDKDGTIVDSGFTNLSTIKAGEKYKVEYTTTKEFEEYTVTIKSSALED